MNNITLRMPCWTIFDPIASKMEGRMNFTFPEIDGKSCFQLFMSDEEAKRCIQAVGLTGKAPTSFDTKASLVDALTQLQAQGLAAVHFYDRGPGGLKRHDIPVGDFLQGLQDGSMRVILGTFRLSPPGE